MVRRKEENIRVFRFCSFSFLTYHRITLQNGQQEDSRKKGCKIKKKRKAKRTRKRKRIGRSSFSQSYLDARIALHNLQASFSQGNQSASASQQLFPIFHFFFLLSSEIGSFSIKNLDQQHSSPSVIRSLENFAESFKASQGSFLFESWFSLPFSFRSNKAQSSRLYTRKLRLCRHLNCRRDRRKI